MTRRWLWTLLLAPLLGPFVWLAAKIWPAEDAVILYRYADHLSRGMGIVYNAQGPRAEGATDFGWMVLLSLGRWTGSAYPLAVVLSMAAGCLTALLLSRLSAIRDVRSFVAFVCLIFLGPMVGAAIEGFSVFFSGMVLTMAIVMAVERKSRSLYAVCFLATLVRPDASILLAPLVIGDLTRGAPSGERLQRLRDCALLLVLPGAIYFMWRWSYFGLPMPLPFYIKVLAARRVAGLFVPTSLVNVFRQALTVAPLAVSALLPRDRLSWPKVAPALVGVAAFLFYASVSLEQDVSGRFEYPIVVAALALWAVDIRSHGLTRRSIVGMAMTLVFWLPASVTSWLDTYRTSDEGAMVDVCRALGRLPHGRLATTEAGRLAYYSDWDVSDLWGLNDPTFARHFVQPQDVAALQADLIVLHMNLQLLQHRKGLEPKGERSWDGMTTNALIGMEDDYDLWLVPFETPSPGPASHAYSWMMVHQPLELTQRYVVRSIYRVAGNTTKLATYDRFLAQQDAHERRLDLFAIRKSSGLSASLRALAQSAGGTRIRE